MLSEFSNEGMIPTVGDDIVTLPIFPGPNPVLKSMITNAFHLLTCIIRGKVWIIAESTNNDGP